MSYALRADVCYCIANEQVVLLDLRADRYYSLPAELAGAFCRLTQGLELTEMERGSLKRLVGTNLLVEGEGFFTPSSPSIPHPSSSVMDDVFPRPGPIRFAGAIYSQLKTTAVLNTLDIYRVLSDIRQKKGDAKGRLVNHTADQVMQASADFLSTRALISNQDRCLPRSIALMHYLMARSLYPNLVVGVQMAPFLAHAWVQHEEVILNDRVDEVLPYTPILVI